MSTQAGERLGENVFQAERDLDALGLEMGKALRGRRLHLYRPGASGEPLALCGEFVFWRGAWRANARPGDRYCPTCSAIARATESPDPGAGR